MYTHIYVVSIHLQCVMAHRDADSATTIFAESSRDVAFLSHPHCEGLFGEAITHESPIFL